MLRGSFIFDVATFSNKYINELTNSGLNNLGGVLQGQNPLQITAAPLAAAIRAAKDSYANDAKPIPNDVRTGLRGYFSEVTLAKAKYAVGTVEITLPNFIGQGNKLFGNDYAVTVDDIIVFNTEPPPYNQNPCWWAHEMTHVQQYEQLGGIEVFAYEYELDHQRLEDDADANASRITKLECHANSAGSQNSPNRQSRLNVGSFDMSGYKDGVDYEKNPEHYIAQAIFSAEKRPINYLITNYGRIVAVDPIKGDWSHIGYAIPSDAPGAAWDYKTEKERYSVSMNGVISSRSSTANVPGNGSASATEAQVGYVRLLKTVSSSYSPADPMPNAFNSPSNPDSLIVTRTYLGAMYHFKVDFTIPLSGLLPGQRFEQITIYGYRLLPIGRFDSPPNMFPTIPGNWKPGDKVSFELNVPYEVSDPADGYYLHFCVGSPAACLVSPNLLRGAPREQ